MLGPEIIYTDSVPSIVHSIKSKFPSYQYLILTDEHISQIHLPSFQAEMQANGLKYMTYILPSGELNKSHDSIVKVQDFMFTNHFNRTDILIALGGGLLTDFGGFVSAIYMRGVAFINIPTTLLSMVDASVGSKTAINTKFGKNLVGSFYDSKAIYVNVNFLKTLDDRNFSNGFAEIIKAALLVDKDLFHQLETCNVRDLKEKNQKELEGIIKRSIDIKVSFVLKDKKESHLRKLLNLGHTIGHGIEYALHEELLHGECLGIGMTKMLEIGMRKGIIEENTGFEVMTRLKGVLDRFKLPYRVPNELNLKHVLLNMMSDKKNEAQEIRFVFIKDIGVYHEKSVAVEIPLIMEVLSNKIHPIQCEIPAQGTPFEPDTVGSKSITNRVILMGSLAEGTLEIDNFVQAEDTEVLLTAMKALGLCQVLDSKKNKLTLKGTGGHFKDMEFKEEIVIDIQNSGLSSRFLLCLLSFIRGQFLLTGNEYMRKRPVGDLIKALRKNTECEFEFLGNEDCLPVRIRNHKKNHGLKGGEILISSKTSSQYVSALLLCAPLAQKPVTITLEDISDKDEITSEPYIEMTLRLMKEFGVDAKKVSYNSYFVPSGLYKNPAKFLVEPDFTALTYDLAFVALFGGSVKIKNISENPLQNDANFPKEVLTQIGMEVESLPTEHAIIVKRDIKKHLTPITVNLNKFPDCFLTLAVIASQIKGITRITGISNQRQKECNRIKTVCHNLVRSGVFAHEIPDGLVIYGHTLQALDTTHVQRKRVLIETNKDHRVAMSFTILAAYFEHIHHPFKLLIDDKLCVNKTFPEYFTHLQKTYGMRFNGEFEWDPRKEDFESGDSNLQNYLNQGYLILVGMRGVGKSTTAKLVEKQLGWRNYDLDEIVLERMREKDPSLVSLREMVDKLGWGLFREIEKKIFYEHMQKIIEKELFNCVVCCGGGIVEDDENFELLGMMDHVIWIETSDIEEAEEVATNDKSRPCYEKESFVQVYNRRKERFESVSNHIICIPGRKNVEELNVDNYFKKVDKMKLDELIHIVEDSNYKVLLKEDTFFLCVSMERADLLTNEEFHYIRNNYTALEITISDFVVSVLGNNLINPSEEVLMALVEIIRHKIARIAYYLEKLEIIITLRTEGRNFEMSNQVYNLIVKGLQKSNKSVIFDCEYRANNLAFLNSFANAHHNIILSKHFFEAITEDNVMKEFERMFAFAEYHHKSVKIFKFVLPSSVNNSFIEDVRNKASVLAMPNLIFKLGLQGRFSRLEAKVYLPVFDSKVMKAVIEGQLQKSDVMRLRQELYMDCSLTKKFYIIGDGVSKSLSPMIHNFLFQQAGLQDHLYDYRNIEKEEDLYKLLHENDFVGGSVTIPHKKTIIKYLDFLVGEAKEIGVVNTVVKSQGKFYGFNTDWYGIYHTFNERMNELGWTHLKNHVDVKKYVLILGAGATCETAIYTFSKFMNFEILVLNRSSGRFANLVSKGVRKEHLFSDPKAFEQFYSQNVFGNGGQIVCVFNTIPNDEAIPILNKIEEKVLKNLLNEKCIVCHLMAFKKDTEFLKFVRKMGTFHVIDGINFLVHQGKLQGEIFTQKEVCLESLQSLLKC